MEFLTPQFVSAVGIPAALCFYTMFKLNESVNKLTDAVNTFKEEIKERDKNQTAKIEKIEHEIIEIKFQLGVNHK